MSEGYQRHRGKLGRRQKSPDKRFRACHTHIFRLSGELNMTFLTYLISVLKATGSALKIATLAWKGLCYISSLRGERVNPLALPDQEFTFLDSVFPMVSRRVYCPTTAEEMCRCKSLCNSGVLRKVGDGYKLTWANRSLVAAKT